MTRRTKSSNEPRRRALAASLVLLACLSGGQVDAKVVRKSRKIEISCQKTVNPFIKVDYTTEEMIVTLRFAKRCYASHSFENVMAAVSRETAFGSGEALGRGKSCDADKSCRLTIHMPHETTERMKYKIHAYWRGVHGHARKGHTDWFWCTSSPAIADCDTEPSSVD